MSDSEDDFMSDKYLVDAPAPETTYTRRRERQTLQSLRKGQANNPAPLKEREAVRRHEGLNTSLTEKPADGGQAKAMGLMMKMGWKMGEGLGKRRSASPERVGGSEKRSRAEPIRVSMWAGRKGLSARSPSPPPLRNIRRTNPDYLPPERHAALEDEAESYRGFRGQDYSSKDASRKAAKAREILIEKDAERGVKFHPLHAVPTDPLALPRPLLRLIYPEYAGESHSPSPVPGMDSGAEKKSEKKSIQEGVRAPPLSRIDMSSAARLREQMRRDMLSELGGDEDGMRFSVAQNDAKASLAEAKAEATTDGDEPNWQELTSGTKRVLNMTPEQNLAFLVSQLRTEHLFCFWCAFKYSSWEEMNAPGGCPGEEEDDH